MSCRTACSKLEGSKTISPSPKMAKAGAIDIFATSEMAAIFVRIEPSLKVVWRLVLVIGGQIQICRQVNFHPVAFANGVSRQHVQVPIQNVERRLRKTARNALPVDVQTGFTGTVARVGLCEACD